jgi:hypothetical protein
MTPYYSEDVLLSKDDLLSKNSDGISTLLYLQTLYMKDWINFLERRGIVDEHLIWGKRDLQVFIYIYIYIFMYRHIFIYIYIYDTYTYRYC